MEFLEKLYSNENFGLYLVITIAILVVLFFIVLFMGKSDEKKTKALKNKKEEVTASEDIPLPVQPVQNSATPIPIKPIGENNSSGEAMVIGSPVVSEVSIPTPVEPISNIEPAFKEVTNEVPVEVPAEVNQEVTQNVVLNEDVNDVKEVEPPVEEEPKEFDFDALADAINKELESIKEAKLEETLTKAERPVIEEKPFAFPNFETVEPDRMPQEVIKQEKEEEIKPVLEEKPKMPDVFSSVYVNRNSEVAEPKPAKPVPFELPKMADMPKKVEKDVHSFLDDIEEETYQIDK